MIDPLTETYSDLIEDSYDCPDRIVLNAYFGIGHSPGGFRNWRRRLFGSDEDLNKPHFINHYFLHIMDPEWGHVTVRMSSHPPFGAQVILNGHEYVERQARRAGVHFGKDGNCFTSIIGVADDGHAAVRPS